MPYQLTGLHMERVIKALSICTATVAGLLGIKDW